MKFVCWRCWNVECKKDKELRKSKAPKCRLLKKAYGIQHYAGRFGRGQALAALEKMKFETKKKTQ